MFSCKYLLLLSLPFGTLLALQPVIVATVLGIGPGWFWFCSQEASNSWGANDRVPPKTSAAHPALAVRFFHLEHGIWVLIMETR